MGRDLFSKKHSVFRRLIPISLSIIFFIYLGNGNETWFIVDSFIANFPSAREWLKEQTAGLIALIAIGVLWDYQFRKDSIYIDDNSLLLIKDIIGKVDTGSLKYSFLDFFFANTVKEAASNNMRSALQTDVVARDVSIEFRFEKSNIKDHFDYINTSTSTLETVHENLYIAVTSDHEAASKLASDSRILFVDIVTSPDFEKLKPLKTYSGSQILVLDKIGEIEIKTKKYANIGTKFEKNENVCFFIIGNSLNNKKVRIKRKYCVSYNAPYVYWTAEHLSKIRDITIDCRSFKFRKNTKFGVVTSFPVNNSLIVEKIEADKIYKNDYNEWIMTGQSMIISWKSYK